ncbi:hypothetical protein [Domibacillus antri]|nr:hypothetical protein [Domibacillus antri]
MARQKRKPPKIYKKQGFILADLLADEIREKLMKMTIVKHN